MRIRLAVEDMEPNHWIAWAVDLPGCFNSATTAQSAIANAPQKIIEYFSWLSKHDGSLLVVDDTIETEVIETFQSFPSSEDPDYIVNAFFESDRRPLRYWDVEIVLRLLTWTRQDLLAVVHSLIHDTLNMSIPDEVRGSIIGIIDHIAIAENWYLGQLGCGLARADLPEDPLEKLEQVRANTREQLAKLIGDERITKDFDELWSARKVVRRALWHERDHTQHIVKLLGNIST
jgi:hypothetical protein